MIENERATLVCDVNDKDANVEWWHDGVQIKIDGQKFVAEAENRKRRLLINSAKLEDHGEYKCTTKDDQTLAQLIVDGPQLMKLFFLKQFIFSFFFSRLL